jgi:hypothetical protein
MTLRTILEHYDLVEEDPFLLRARSQPRSGGERLLASTSVPWDSWAEVPATPGPMIARVEFGPSLVRAVVRLLLREDPTYLDLRFADGGETTYRFVPDNAPRGVWINPLPTTRDELTALLKGVALEKRVNAIRFRGASPIRRTGELTITWVELEPRT